MGGTTKPKRPLGLGAYVLVLVGVGLVGGLAGGLQGLISDHAGPYGAAATIALMAVTLAVALAACVWWWRGIDEAAREAHKWAWWWGGSGGMAVGALVLLSVAANEDASSAAAMDLSAGELLLGGMWIILMFQLAGYAVAWAAWWLKHR
ncbi:hypothetical protein [Brevundimonas sp.]|uniref:hypothetical protein n=1 Tax=Brevundimonas sp. TaxID=1871086 RepID=UPI002FC5E361